MRRAIALARRELQGKGLLLMGALLLGLLPFVIPRLTATGIDMDSEARDVTANVLAVFLGTGLAIFLGYFAIGEDLAEGRLGFYFSRPLRNGEIWAGKFFGNLVTILLSALLVVVPVTLAGGGLLKVTAWQIPSATRWLPLPEVSGVALVAAMAVILILVFCLAHVIGIAIRAHSVWLLIDLVAGSATVISLTLSSRRLVLAWAIEAWRRGLIGLAAGMTVALILACLLSLGAARTNLRMAARTTSLAWIAVLIPCALGFEIYSRWVVSVSPRDLGWQDVSSASLARTRGQGWLILVGAARRRGDYEPYFLWNPERDSSVHIGDLGYQGTVWSAFSPDGTVAAWLKLTLGADSWEHELHFADLSGSAPVVVRTRLTMNAWSPGLLISPDDRSVAAFTARTISILDLPTGSRRGSYNLPPTSAGLEGLVPRAHFSDSRTLEIFRPVAVRQGVGSTSLDHFRLDISARRLTTLASVTPPSDFQYFSTDPPAERVLLREKRAHNLSLHETRTGGLLHRFLSTSDANIQWGEFLPDGRIAVAEAGRSGVRLRIMTPDGREQLKVIELGGGGGLVFGGWIDRDHLSLLIRPAEAGPSAKGRLLLVSLSNGEVRPIGSDLYPVAWRLRWNSFDTALRPEPGSIASRLFEGQDGSLLEYQTSSGTFRTLLPGSRGR